MRSLSFLTIIFCCSTAFAQNPIGIFENHADIGNPKKAGSAQYDEGTQTYNIKGGGYNIWFNRDEFHYLYKKIKGDFILTADFGFTGDTANSAGHRKIGWMVRESTDEGAASMNAVIHIDGHFAFQWRTYRGMFMRDPEDEFYYTKNGGQTIRLERFGNTMAMYVAHWGEPLQFVGSHEMKEMKDEVLAGLFICSHDSDKVVDARVWNVRIDHPVPGDYHPMKTIQRYLKPMTAILSSRLETMKVADGKRTIIHESAGRFESPSWSPDGKKLLYNEGGSVYTIPAEGGTPEKLNGTPEKPSSTSEKLNNPIAGKIRKTKDGEYSPDGRYIYYNSGETGTTQVWRMKPDGSAKEQLTFDEYHSWFPHISPDGKWIAFLSYSTDIAPNSHPYYKKVMLRLMPAAGGAPRVIAFLYGGEGSLNANSWSPDSKTIAFVSNAEKAELHTNQ